MCGAWVRHCEVLDGLFRRTESALPSSQRALPPALIWRVTR